MRLPAVPNRSPISSRIAEAASLKDVAAFLRLGDDCLGYEVRPFNADEPREKFLVRTLERHL